MQDKKSELVKFVRESVIGADTQLDGPFGATRLIYADYTASGRCLDFIEEYLAKQVMPFYANTHTMMSGTGRQTTALREQARGQSYAPPSALMNAMWSCSVVLVQRQRFIR